MPLVAIVMNVTVEALSNTSVRVSWKNINNSELMINYRVYYGLTGDMDDDFVFLYSTGNSIIIGDLLFNGTMGYLFYVIASAEVNGVTFTGQKSRTVMFKLVSSTERMLPKPHALKINCFVCSSF